MGPLENMDFEICILCGFSSIYGLVVVRVFLFFHFFPLIVELVSSLVVLQYVIAHLCCCNSMNMCYKTWTLVLGGIFLGLIWPPFLVLEQAQKIVSGLFLILFIKSVTYPGHLGDRYTSFGAQMWCPKNTFQCLFFQLYFNKNMFNSSQ